MGGIYIGNNKFSGVYVGDSQVQSVYDGNSLIYNHSSERLVTETLAADFNKTVNVINNPVVSIQSVTNADTGTVITDYTIKNVGLSFGSPIIDGFAGKHYSKDVERIVSTDGKLIGFIDNGVLDLYDISGDTVVKRDTSIVDLTYAYMVRFIEDILYVKTNNNGVYGVSLYIFMHNTGKYATGRNYANANNYVGVRTVDHWFDFQLVKHNYSAVANRQYYLMLVCGDTGNGSSLLFYYQIYLYNTDVINYAGYNSSSLFLTTKVYMYPASNTMDACTFYKSSSNGAFVYRTFNDYDRSNNSALPNSLVNGTIDGEPKFAKGYVYGTVASLGKIIFYKPVERLGYEKFFTGVDKMYMSYDMNYLVIKNTSGGYDCYYIDADLNFTQFVSSISSLVNVNNIVDIDFGIDKMILFLNDNTNIIIPLNNDRAQIMPFDAGNNIQVSYMAN